MSTALDRLLARTRRAMLGRSLLESAASAAAVASACAVAVAWWFPATSVAIVLGSVSVAIGFAWRRRPNLFDAARWLDAKLATSDLFATALAAHDDAFGQVVQAKAIERAHAVAAIVPPSGTITARGWAARLILPLLLLVVLAWPVNDGLNDRGTPGQPTIAAAVATLTRSPSEKNPSSQAKSARAAAIPNEEPAATRDGHALAGRDSPAPGGGVEPSNESGRATPPPIARSVAVAAGNPIGRPGGGGGGNASAKPGAGAGGPGGASAELAFRPTETRLDLAATASGMIRRREIPDATAAVVRAFFERGD